jgi:hypothetical protein
VAQKKKSAADYYRENRKRAGKDRAGPEGNGESLGLATTCLDQVKAEPIVWLVPDRVPLGKLVMLAGDGGEGKTTLLLGMTANFTRGKCCFGLAYDPPEVANVLIASCEDDFADTVVPRLLVAGADLARVHRIDGVKGKDGRPLPFNLSHFAQLEEELDARPGVRLVIIDPAGAYVGAAGVDDHKESAVRALLGPLALLAARRRVTILIVKHFHKGATVKAVHKVSASIGYINSVRAAFVVVPDKEDADKKLFLPLKFNIGPKPKGLSDRMQALTPEEQGEVLALPQLAHPQGEDRERLGKQLFRVEWLGEVDIDADSAIADAQKRERGPSKVDQCVEWLREFLKDYAYPSDEIVAAAKATGFTFDNQKEAKARLKADGLRSSNRGRFQGEWWSGIGFPDTWKPRPEPGAGQSGEAQTLSPPSPHSPESPHNGAEFPPIARKVGIVGSGGSGENAPQTDNGYADGIDPFPDQQ